jgi:hypothetical protein
VKSKQWKLASAAIGAGALVAMGSLGAALADESSSVGIFSEPADMTIGETETSTTAETEIETSLATPPVTAELPDGYGMG